MKVFVSWSGEDSLALAQILRSWLPLAVQSIDPFVSEEDISKGTRWVNEVSSELADCVYGIICVTPNNMNAPWLNFEAGALSKNLGDRVSPILRDLKKSDLTGPLSIFQATAIERDDMHRLLESINSASQTAAMKPEQLTGAFDLAWPKLKAEIETLPAATARSGSDNIKAARERSSTELLEELLELTRTQLRIMNEPQDLLPASYLLSVLGSTRSNPSFDDTLIVDLTEIAHELRFLIDSGELPATLNKFLVRLEARLGRVREQSSELRVVSEAPRPKRPVPHDARLREALVRQLSALGMDIASYGQTAKRVLVSTVQRPTREAMELVARIGEDEGVTIDLVWEGGAIR